MKKVLVLGVGNQGEKYVRYFLKHDFTVFGACKTEKTQSRIAKKYGIQVVLDYQDFLETTSVDIIIIAISPAISGEIAYTLGTLYPKTKIIVEIPVCWDIDVLDTLIPLENVYFYVEEYFTALSTFCIKSGLTHSDFSVVLKTHTKDYSDMFARRVSFIHILNNFLSFRHKINSLKVDVVYHDSEDIFYEIHFSYKGVPIVYVFDVEKKLSIGDKTYTDEYHFDMTLGKVLDGNFDNMSLKKSYRENYLFIENKLLD